jgi:CDP-glucose 4,6-dehydratase
VFITGHTGFKGVWLSKLLLHLGAEVSGYALSPSVQTNLFDIIELDKDMESIIGDIRDRELLNKSIKRIRPDIVIHMAAQPLVIESYKNPVYTYETNVMGTVNLLDAIRSSDSVRSIVNVTTDKVYKNRESEVGYCEDEYLDGYDPYSNSKSCSELVTNSYRNAFFRDTEVSLSTARSGNVIGGGDFADNRIIPDCFRAVSSGKNILIRNPHSIRPYQHVLEPLSAYLLIAEKQYDNKKIEGAYNVGPYEKDCITTEQLVELFCNSWGENIKYNKADFVGVHEATYLKLNCKKIRSVLGWQPQWSIDKAISMTVEWMKTYQLQGNISHCMNEQINEYLKEVPII